MLKLLVLAVLVAAIVWIVCIGLGRFLKSIPSPFTTAIGGFLEQFAIAIGGIAGLWYFVTGGDLPF